MTHNLLKRHNLGTIKTATCYAQRTRGDSNSFRTVFDAWESAQNKLEASYNRHVCANLISAFADEFETSSSRVVCAVP